MRWLRCQTKDEPFYGFLNDNIVSKVHGSPFDGYEQTTQKIPVEEVKILPPVIPKTFYAAGGN